MNTYQFTKNNDSIVGISGDNLIAGTIPTTHGVFKRIQRQVEQGEVELIPFVAPSLTWQQIRAQRDALLKDCDWTTTIDANPKPSKEAWLTYRQALRDVPQNFTTAEEVVWPSTPE